MTNRPARFVFLLLSLALIAVAGTRATAQAFPEETLTSAHFTVTFQTDPSDGDAPDLSDSDADGEPDSIERLLLSLESARSFIVDELLFPEPLDADPYPVYVIAGDKEPHVRTVPEDEGRTRATFMVVPPHHIRAAVPQEDLTALMVHEYFHAVQFAHDYLEQAWFRESSAAWLQQEVHPGHPLLWTVPDLLTSLEEGLAGTGGDREYGGYIFLSAVGQALDLDRTEMANMLASAWNHTRPAEVDAFEALDLALRELGWSLEDAWASAQVWFRRLGHFDEAELLRGALRGTGWRTTEVHVVRGSTCRVHLVGEPSLPEFAAASSRIRSFRGTEAAATLSAAAPSGSSLIFLSRNEPERIFPITDGAVHVPITLGGRASTITIATGLGGGRVAFSVTEQGHEAAIELTAARGSSSLRYGFSLALRGEITCKGVPTPYTEAFLVERRTDGSEIAHPIETDQDGTWKATIEPEMDATFSVRLADPLLGEATGPGRKIAVEQFVTMKAVAGSGRWITASGSVTPHVPGATIGLEYRRPEAARWRSEATTTVDTQGSYVVTFALPASGVWELRTRLLDDLDPHRQAGTSVFQVVRLD